MREQGFTRTQADGELFHQLWQEDQNFGKDLSEALAKFSGTFGPDEALAWLEGLQSMVPARKTNRTILPLADGTNAQR